MNWGQHFFEFVPNPPMNFFKNLENVLKFHDIELYTYFKSFKSGLICFIWPSIQVFFTDILNSFFYTVISCKFSFDFSKKL